MPGLPTIDNLGVDYFGIAQQFGFFGNFGVSGDFLFPVAR
jgi:hypothetical protein